MENKVNSLCEQRPQAVEPKMEGKGRKDYFDSWLFCPLGFFSGPEGLYETRKQPLILEMKRAPVAVSVNLLTLDRQAHLNVLGTKKGGRKERKGRKGKREREKERKNGHAGSPH